VLQATTENERARILASWLRSSLEAFAPSTQDRLLEESDTVEKTVLERLLAGLLGHAEVASLRPVLDQLVRACAVGDLTPSEACGFFFHLKGALRETLGPAPSPEEAEELERLDSRVDRLALLAFDRALTLRERIAELKRELRGGRTLTPPRGTAPPVGPRPCR
jgi:hypothetical protein